MATLIRGQVDVRRPWPPFNDRAAAIATRLVAGLARTEPCRGELARIAHWRAGLRWEALELPRIRDRPTRRVTAERCCTDCPGRCASTSAPEPACSHVGWEARMSRGPGRAIGAVAEGKPRGHARRRSDRRAVLAGHTVEGNS